MSTGRMLVEAGVRTRRPVAVRPRRTEAPANTLDAVFARTARHSPRAVAVKEGTHELTYGRAEMRASQLASALIGNGVQLGDPVLIHCPDHRRAAVAQLAVLKAGGVCVPVPPHTSREDFRRLARLLGARVVVCGSSAVAGWTEFGRVVVLDEETWQRIGAMRVDRSLPRSGPLEGAHLFRTGEDGTGPDAQLTDHRAWLSALSARPSGSAMDPMTVVAHEPPMGARSLSALWWAFATGGAFHAGPRPEEAPGPLARRVNTAAVFSADEYAGLLDGVAGGEKRRAPRVVVLMGGPCPPELVERHFALLPTTRLWCEFTPVGGVLPWTVRRTTPDRTGTGAPDTAPAGPGTQMWVNVGRPAPGVRLRVLSPEGLTVSRGGTGEVCAAGDGLPCGIIRATAYGPGSVDGTALRHSGQYGRVTEDGTVEVTWARDPARPAVRGARYAHL
ncbi:AMP-binding protein [Streptomyces sp. NBC_00893]|uniref:AMP-binding protein n=1 Tax=Streptomyces sp. NBC_00893 TaxID=2975862 RepID=UPI002252E482|nr:class I adenylate-forming enzyme family protein [Streptomyces sp. NBC_00893]MCX4849546.1 acyl--CoA ligase [Streptomyces sp. NBC_00893]